jgi:hypothetical protein
MHMQMNSRELWTVIHGMVFGFIFLLGSSGAIVGLYGLKSEWQTAEGTNKNVRILKIYMWALAVLVWAAVFTGTYIIYPWYRAAPPVGAYDFSTFPRYLLLSSASTEGWQEFGMEWKEHVAFLAPIAATVAAFVVNYYGAALAHKVQERRAVMIFFIFAFTAAAAAGLFGALIAKVAPVH